MAHGAGSRPHSSGVISIFIRSQPLIPIPFSTQLHNPTCKWVYLSFRREVRSDFLDLFTPKSASALDDHDRAPLIPVNTTMLNF